MVCFFLLIVVYFVIESIWNGECEVVFVGGVNLFLYLVKYISYGSVGMYLSDGYCYIFGKGGDGYVFGEGVGIVLLKFF